MLQQTFIHIPGVGKQTELDLWEHGICSWDDADRFEKRFGYAGVKLHQKLDEYIPRSREAIRNKDASFFQRLSSLGEAWRIFPEFADQCVYLDIESTGLSSVFDNVTMVGLYDGRKYDVFIEGRNLPDFQEQLKKYSVIVTYNGSGFDLRFLRFAFPDLVLPPIHIDLRWTSRRLGFNGGLKEVERQLGIRRPAEVENISGYDATVLWSRYQRGDRAALDQLIQYNTEDVVHLKAIMEMTYDRLAKVASSSITDSVPRLFAGISDMPSAPKLVRRRAVKALPEGNLVAHLLSRVPDKTEPRIVGIDLTGSEKRATGWALMEGAKASTTTMITDRELLAETIAAKPDLVSIDSPLSLPDGWKLDDKNPGIPIYRKCELALKRMGISVFWCMLPTMQGLTTRGMKLAAELRKAGLNVIESYPGAAQDILNIPRKGTSLDELKQGLGNAGVKGPFLTEKVCHDEVDAITSALVGLFYIADEFMALGTPSEDYLIVPRSLKFNFQKLAAILEQSGLDKLPERPIH
jgi:uncharacterized protein YprB with RNaseH-like and TPR domain/predicted nuclease with RNAse H fold